VGVVDKGTLDEKEARSDYFIGKRSTYQGRSCLIICIIVRSSKHRLASFEKHSTLIESISAISEGRICNVVGEVISIPAFGMAVGRWFDMGAVQTGWTSKRKG
jgi:hypothetical protein